MSCEGSSSQARTIETGIRGTSTARKNEHVFLEMYCLIGSFSRSTIGHVMSVECGAGAALRAADQLFRWGWGCGGTGEVGAAQRATDQLFRWGWGGGGAGEVGAARGKGSGRVRGIIVLMFFYSVGDEN